MSTSPRLLLRTALAGALGAVALLGPLAVYEIARVKWVREFQAGPESPWSERAVAVAQRTAIEGVGFGLLALALGVVAWLLAKSLRHDPRTTFTQRYLSSLILAIAGFIAWDTFGAWLANEALPFLSAKELLLLNLAGFVGCALAFVVFDRLVRLMPRTPREEPVAVSLASAAAAGLAAFAGLRILWTSSGSWRSPLRLGLAALVAVAAIPAASYAAAKLRPIVAAIGKRWSERPLLPRPVGFALLGVLGLAVVTAAPSFRLSAVPAELKYRTLAARGTPKGPNVVFVTVDTLRADALGCYGAKRPTSPFLDSLAAEGVRFADVSAAAAWTKPATGTIFTGLYPSRHGALYHGSKLQLPDGNRTMAQAFQDAGYATAGFVSNPNIKRIFDFDRGFDEFFDSPVEDTVSLASMREARFGRLLTDLTRYQFNWKYENDVREMNRHALAWLDANRSVPFFLYLHYIDPHEPYSPPAAYESQFAQSHPGFPLFNKRKELVGRDLYDGEVRYTDDGIRALVEELKRHGIWDKTLFVLTSDHGEEFYEHGMLGHGFSLYQEVIRVPLLMRGPGIAKGQAVKGPVQIVDLPATVLELAGTGVSKLGDGSSFAAALLDEGWKRESPIHLENEFGENDNDTRSFVFAGIREGPWKLILTERHLYRPPESRKEGPAELFNLETDAGEKTSVASAEANRPLMERLLQALQKHAQFLQETGFRNVKPTALDPATEAQLKAVGYLGGK